MRGHEHLRGSVLAYLAATVPVRLAMLRADLGVTSPADPAAYVAADALTGTAYPLVVVRSATVDAIRSAGTPVPGETSTWAARYGLEVVVACDTGTHGDYPAACTDRDRLLLAVREALLLAGTVGAGIELQRNGITEQTGAAAETLQGRPLAAGSVSLAAIVVEDLAPLAGSTTETAAAADIEVAMYDPSQSLP